MATRVLIVEDEREMQVILRDNLEYEGYEVLSAETGERGVELVMSQQPDIVLLDVMLPKMSGYEVCKKIRAASVATPVIMLTARNSEIDRVNGLEFGADDYLGKPFNIRELLARIKARLRRYERVEQPPDVFTFGDTVIDVARRAVLRRSRRLDLSSREFELLWYLVSHRGQLVPREQLLMEVWGYHNLSLTRTVDNFVAKLRRKIEPNPRAPRHILTVHGSGYRFVC